jgi:hypothetical protein
MAIIYVARPRERGDLVSSVRDVESSQAVRLDPGRFSTDVQGLRVCPG